MRAPSHWTRAMVGEKIATPRYMRMEQERECTPYTWTLECS